MIEIKNIVKNFGDFVAIDNLSFSVENGSIYGLAGYNGAGKTTLLKIIADVYRATSGGVYLNGEKVEDNPERKSKIFYVPDDLYFLANSNLEKMAAYYSKYYPTFNFDSFEKLVTVFGIDKKKKINGFSKGMQRQAEIILALSVRPEVLLLDESFDGLDPGKRNLTRKILIEYANDTDASIIISSHNLRELEDLCDHVGLINEKKLVINSSVDDMSEKMCKFRLVFNENYTKDDFKELNIMKFENDGKIIIMTVEGDYDETEKILMKKSPLLIEKFPLTLEEIFLNEMEDTDYDLTKIF